MLMILIGLLFTSGFIYLIATDKTDNSKQILENYRHDLELESKDLADQLASVLSKMDQNTKNRVYVHEQLRETV